MDGGRALEFSPSLSESDSLVADFGLGDAADEDVSFDSGALRLVSVGAALKLKDVCHLSKSS